MIASTAICVLTMALACTPNVQVMQVSSSRQTQPNHAMQRRPSIAYSIDDLLWWLPEDSQTFSVAQGPFQITADEPSEDVSAKDYATLLFRSIVLGSVRTIKSGDLIKQLAGRNVLVAAEGSRKYRAPKSLGGMRFEGCNIVIFEQALPTTLIDQLTPRAWSVQTILGKKVVVFEERLEEDIWKFFLATPAPNVLLCATNEGYLTQVIARMNKKGTMRALPDSLPEWKHVDTNSAFWSVRHYDPEDAKYDPSSPLNGKHSVSWPDEGGVGVVVEFDPVRSDSVRLRYLSQNEKALVVLSDEMAKASNLGEPFKPFISQKEPGVVEMEVSIQKPEQIGMFAFVLLFVLGHGVYV